jgi:hypothetical protein
MLPRFLQHHRAMAHGIVPGFNPITSASAVTEWYRNSTVGAITTYPALINTGSPGVVGPAGATHRPTGNADLSLTFDGGDDIRIPLATPNNGATVWGFGLWIKPSLSAQQTLYNAQATSGASSTKARIDVMANGSVQAVTLTSGTAATAAGALTTNVAKFLSVEYNGLASAGQRFKIFVDGVDLTTADSSPTALNQPTGNSEIMAQDASGGGTSYIGIIGRSFFFYGGAVMVGATSGIHTAAVRAALRSVDPLS